jgi:phosphate-selective porin OprO/OprP
MILRRQVFPIAVLAAIATSAAHAEIKVGSIGGSDLVLEGLLQVDGNWFNNDLTDLGGNGADGDDSEFDLRRTQIVLKGKGPGQYEWVIGYDVKSERFLDVNARYDFTGSGSQYVQVGQFKQPNGMEGLSSTRNNDFISKSAATNTYAIGRRLGAAYSFGGGVWNVTASWFSRELTRNFGHGYGYGLRSTWAPVNDRGNILHLGLAYVDYDTDTDTFRVSARPDADLATARLVDTGDMIDTDRVATTSIEALWIRGPFKLQGEYYTSDIKRLANSDYTSTAGYIQGVWNLTGETWGYRGGVPTTPLPDQPGSGMWQLGLRYDTIDLNDGAVEGGQMNTWTSGVNWYWRSNFKFALNYVKVDSERQGLSDDPDIVEARVQFGW